MPLSQEDITALLERKTRGSKVLKPDVPPVERYLPEPQNGPIRWIDKEHRCVSKGCSSPTYLKLQGVSFCLMHTLKKCNEMLIELGVAA